MVQSKFVVKSTRVLITWYIAVGSTSLILNLNKHTSTDGSTRSLTFWILSPPDLKASKRMFLIASSKSPRTYRTLIPGQSIHEFKISLYGQKEKNHLRKWESAHLVVEPLRGIVMICQQRML